MEHIPLAPFVSELVDDLYQASCAHEHKAHGLEWARLMGMARMYQPEDAICDAHGPHQTIRRKLKRIFHRYRLIRYTYELLRCLEIEIR